MNGFFITTAHTPKPYIFLFISHRWSVLTLAIHFTPDNLFHCNIKFPHSDQSNSIIDLLLDCLFSVQFNIRACICYSTDVSEVVRCFVASLDRCNAFVLRWRSLSQCYCCHGLSMAYMC